MEEATRHRKLAERVAQATLRSLLKLPGKAYEGAGLVGTRVVGGQWALRRANFGRSRPG